MAKSKKTGDPKIARRLRDARKAAGFDSVLEAVEEYELGSGYGHHENATRSITLENAVHYCDIFEINLVWLATGTGPMKGGSDSFASRDILAGLTPGQRVQVINLIGFFRNEAAE